MFTTNDFIVRNTFNSNAIEGNKLTIDDVYNILITNNFIINEVNNKDYLEIVNHQEAWEFIIDFINDSNHIIDNNFIIKLNQIINQDIMYIGGYRLGGMKIIGSDKTFPHPFEVNELMNQFINHYNQ